MPRQTPGIFGDRLSLPPAYSQASSEAEALMSHPSHARSSDLETLFPSHLLAGTPSQEVKVGAARMTRTDIGQRETWAF